MSTDPQTLSILLAKEEIRELAMLYSRGVDRNDIALLRTLYASDATDNHGRFFSGSADEYLKFLERSLPRLRMSGHFICNHLISVSADRGEGEVYALAYHLIPDGKGGTVEDLQAVRYIDRYKKENGRWLFASRDVTFDMRSIRPVPTPDEPIAAPEQDLSYKVLSSRLFARGPRA